MRWRTDTTTREKVRVMSQDPSTSAMRAHLTAQDIVARGRGNLVGPRDDRRLKLLAREVHCTAAIKRCFQSTIRLLEGRGDSTGEGTTHNHRTLLRIVPDSLQERTDRVNSVNG